MTITEIGASAGGGTTTAADMWNFGQALRKREILDKDKFEIMIQNQSDGDYGYGFMIDNGNSHEYYGHNGGIGRRGEKLGVASYFFISDDEYTIIALTNRNPSISGVGMDLHEILTIKEAVK